MFNTSCALGTRYIKQTTSLAETRAHDNFIETETNHRGISIDDMKSRSDTSYTRVPFMNMTGTITALAHEDMYGSGLPEHEL